MVWPYYYINYNKSEAKKIITEKYDWVDYGGHHHENIFSRYVIGVWLLQKFNIDKRKVTLSAYIRNSEILREEALKILNTTPYSKDLIEEDHFYVSKKLGLSIKEFNEIWEIENKTFLDYPSYYPLYQKLKWFVKYIFKYILPFRPMFSYDFEKKDS